MRNKTETGQQRIHIGPVLCLSLAALCFGTGGLFSKMIPWSPLAINGARNLIGAALIGSYLLIRRHRLVFSRHVFIGAISSGAANDLERVTKQAYAMVAYYGMSSAMPNVCYYDSTGQEYSFSKPFSEERAKVIDQEISKIIAEQYQRAKELLLLHQDGHNRLAQTLEEREVIFTEDVEQIFGPRPWTSRTDELLKESEVTEQKSAEAPAKNNTNQ